MKKHFMGLALVCMMLVSLLGTTAYAADVEIAAGPEAFETAADVTPRIKGEDVYRHFDYAGQSLPLFSDGNWFDAKVVIDNLSTSAGSVTVQVIAYDGSGNSTYIGGPFDIIRGGKGTSAKIESRYSSYTVMVTASVAGDYYFNYKDIAA